MKRTGELVEQFGIMFLNTIVRVININNQRY